MACIDNQSSLDICSFWPDSFLIHAPRCSGQCFWFYFPLDKSRVRSSGIGWTFQYFHSNRLECLAYFSTSNWAIGIEAKERMLYLNPFQLKSIAHFQLRLTRIMWEKVPSSFNSNVLTTTDDNGNWKLSQLCPRFFRHEIYFMIYLELKSIIASIQSECGFWHAWHTACIYKKNFKSATFPSKRQNLS